MDTSRITKPGWIWAVLLVTQLPLFGLYIWQVLALPQYHYIPALLLAFGLLFFGSWDKSLPQPHGIFSWSAIFIGQVISLVGAYFWSPWLGAVGFLMLLAALLYSLTDKKFGLLRLWPLACLVIRLPLNLDYELTSWLQRITARVSSLILDRFEIPNHLAGNVFHLSKGTLFVEEACSGIQSVFSLIFVAVLWVTWQRRGIWLIPIYVVFAVAWAGVMNILRVTTICIAQENWMVDLSHGWQHEVLGYLCLLIAIILFLSSDRLIRIFFYPAPSTRDEKVENPIAKLWNGITNSLSAQQANPTKRHIAVVPKVVMPATLLSLVLTVVVASAQAVYGYRHFSASSQAVNTDYWQPNEALVAQYPGVEV